MLGLERKLQNIHSFVWSVILVRLPSRQAAAFIYLSLTVLLHIYLDVFFKCHLFTLSYVVILVFFLKHLSATQHFQGAVTSGYMLLLLHSQDYTSHPPTHTIIMLSSPANPDCRSFSLSWIWSGHDACQGGGGFTVGNVGETIRHVVRALLQLNFCFQLTLHLGMHLVVPVPQYEQYDMAALFTWWVVVRMVFESHQRRFKTLVILFTSLCQCLLEETLMAVGPFYLSDVYARPVQRGSKISRRGRKCVTCHGLHSIMQKDDMIHTGAWKILKVHAFILGKAMSARFIFSTSSSSLACPVIWGRRYSR